MKTYKITFDGKNNGLVRAKTAENALVKFLRLLSATHVLKHGTIARAKRGNAKPLEHASVYLWQGAFQRPVFAVSELIPYAL
jgi:hypothetical protein